MNWVYLGLAIVSEVIGTSALKASDGLTRLGPSLLAMIGFAVALYFLSLTLRTIPVGVAYAIWSGAGIVVISLIGYFGFGQALDPAALVGIGLIMTGVVVINTLSEAGH
jgi:small multidrug resistance pump